MSTAAWIKDVREHIDDPLGTVIGLELRADEAVGALEKLDKLHRVVGVYDECECTDEQKQNGHEEIYEIGLTCNRIYDICDECCRDDVYQREECADHHAHKDGVAVCRTREVLDSLGLGQP